MGNDPIDQVDPTGNDGTFFGYTPVQLVGIAQLQVANGKNAAAQAAGARGAVSYQNRQVALKAGAAIFGVVALTPAAPVALPVSVALTAAAVTDTKITTGHLDTGEILVTGLAAVPGGAEAGAALTGIKEVGEVVKTGQEVLHAGASTLSAGAAIAETRQPAEHNGAANAAQQAQKPDPPKTMCTGSRIPQTSC